MEASESPALLLNELLARVRELTERKPRGWTCLVIGRMGSGKTRLLDTLASSFQLRRWTEGATLRARLSRTTEPSSPVCPTR
jgi:hypothetical protein